MAIVRAEPIGKPPNFTREALAEPFRKFLSRVAITVQGFARQRAPVDTGFLRSGILYQIDPSEVPLWAVITSETQYARPMEYGTGLLSEAPDSKHTRHFPPPAAIEIWVRHKGLVSGVFSPTTHKLIRRKRGAAINAMEKRVAFLIARSIWRKGGLVARNYMHGGLEDTRPQVPGFVQQLDADVQKAIWEK